MQDFDTVRPLIADMLAAREVGAIPEAEAIKRQIETEYGFTVVVDGLGAEYWPNPVWKNPVQSIN